MGTLDRSKKLLMVANDLGFIESHRKEIAIAALREGFEVTIACPESPLAEVYAAQGFNLQSITLKRSNLGVIDEIKCFWSILRVFRTIKPDIVHLISAKPVIYGGLVARLNRVPFVSAISGLGHVFSSTGIRARLVRILASCGFIVSQRSGLGHLIFQNGSDQLVFERLGILKQANSSMLAGSGVDLQAIVPRPLPTGSQRVVLLPARMLRPKGVPEFIAAAELLSESHPHILFRLLGDPDEQNPNTMTRIELSAASKAANIEWSGFTPEIGAELAKAHLVVLPSTYGEGLPKTLIDAAAAGRGVVTTDMPGCRRAVVPGITGELVKPRDVLQLAQTIARLCEDDTRLAEMGAAARLHAERSFDVHQIVEDHLRIYDGLLSQ